MSTCLHVPSGFLRTERRIPVPGAGGAQGSGIRAAAPNVSPEDRECGSCSGYNCETIRRAQQGDALAWEALVRQNAGLVFKLCRHWAGSCGAAEDLAQDVFIKVYMNLGSFRGEAGTFRTWLRRIARNLLIDDYRSHRRERRAVSFESADDCMRDAFSSIPSRELDPEAGAANRERITALRATFRLLGRELRETVMLRDVRGFSYDEISRLLKLPVGTVKSRVNRGRIEIARRMRQRMALCTSVGRSDSAVA